MMTTTFDPVCHGVAAAAAVVVVAVVAFPTLPPLDRWHFLGTNDASKTKWMIFWERSSLLVIIIFWSCVCVCRVGGCCGLVFAFPFSLSPACQFVATGV